MGVVGAGNIGRFTGHVDKLMENQSIKTPKGTGSDIFSKIPTILLSCGNRTRRMDCRYWPGAPAIPKKY